MKLALCGQMREMDRTAIERYGIPGIVLMENAAISIFNIIKELDAYRQKNAVIFCGTGNNGGDGFALARHMHNDGADVSVVVCGDTAKLKDDAKINFDICVRMGIKMISFYSSDLIRAQLAAASCALIVDALLGTGVSGGLKGTIKEAVGLINESSKFVVAIDCPTGGNPDNGHIDEVCVMADLTVSLALLKPGLLMYPLAGYIGQLKIGSIGAPRSVFDETETGLYALDTQLAAELLPPRSERSHKGTYGKAVIVAGSSGMAGAAAYCARASYKSGCGYVTVCAPVGIIPLIQQLAPQAVTIPLLEKNGALYMGSVEEALIHINKSAVCLIGPGLGSNADTAEFVKYIIKNAKKQLIIDADAINAISGEPELLLSACLPPVITPHPLEMSRLTGLATKHILDNILETAKDFADKYNAVTVLKDAVSIISYKNKTYINSGACSALAKAGSGDMLAGIITGLAAQGAASAEAAALGAFILSECGKAAAAKYGNYSVCGDDLLEIIHQVFIKLCQTGG